MSTETTPGADSHLSIGEVLEELRGEFPDVTISKIRFLESQGLIDPERTPSGYRRFYAPDLERLRWILLQQRDHFLPLRVIKERLDAVGPIGAPAEARIGEARGEPRSEPRREPESERHADGRPPSSVESNNGGGVSPRGEPSTAPTAPSTPRPPATMPQPGMPSPFAAPSTTPGPSLPVPAPPVAVPTLLGPPARSAERPAATTSRVQTPDTRPSSPTPGAAPPRPSAPPPSPSRPPTPSPRPTPSASKPAGLPFEAAGSLGESEDEREEIGPLRPRDDTPTTTGLTRAEILEATGITDAQLDALESFGILVPFRGEDGRPLYDDEALTVAEIMAGYYKRGIEPRHLKMYWHFAQREAALMGQVLLPYVRQRNPASRTRLQEEVEELARLGRQLRTAMLRRALRDRLSE